MRNSDNFESASRCDKCGEIVADIDAGFSPSSQKMKHECGGRWQKIQWCRETGAIRNSKEKVNDENN